MAARKKPVSRPKPTSPSGASELDELRAQLAEMQAGLAATKRPTADRDDDGGEGADGGEVPARAWYNPRTHSAVPNEVYAAITGGERAIKDLVVAQSRTAEARTEAMFTGFSVNHQLLTQSLADAQIYGRQERERADKLQQDLAAKDRAIANMIAETEETKTARIRLQADVERGQQANDRLQIQAQADRARHQDELNAVIKASSPVFSALAGGVNGLVQYYSKNLLNPAAAQGNGVVAQGGGVVGPAGQVQPGVEISNAGAEAWRDVTVEDWKRLLPDTCACVRALIFSYALAAHGAPPPPAWLTREKLFELLERDLGGERAIAFLQSLAAAYVAEETPTNGAGPPAPSAGLPN